MDENLLTPQGNNALLKAAIAANDVEGAKMYYNRLMSLRSNKTKHFALKQGVVIAISAYLNSEEDPTPLNTTWFGQCLLDDKNNILNLGIEEKKSLVDEISQYIITEVGYADYGKEGIFFYYGRSYDKKRNLQR